MSNSPAKTFDIIVPIKSLRNRISELPEGQKLNIIEVRVGSDSDFPKIKKILEGLRDYPVLVRIASAHRTPHAMAEIARNFPEVTLLCTDEKDKTLFEDEDFELAEKMNVVLCIAAAGGSAHIAGMTASETEIPLLGFPVPSSTYGQGESDPSMRHMPPGIPNGVSAYEQVLVNQAKEIYDRTPSSSKKIYIAPGLEIDETVGELIKRIGLSVTKAMYDADIGIHTHDVSGTDLDHVNLSPKEVETAVLRKTLMLGTKISIVHPTIETAVDTTTRTPVNAFHNGIIDLNLLTVPGLSMGLSLRGKTNLTNSILLAAKVIGIHDARVRKVLQEYRHELAHGTGAVRDKDAMLVKQQLQ